MFGKLIFLLGTYGSGKSTYARTFASTLGCRIVHTDALRGPDLPPILVNRVVERALQQAVVELRSGRTVVFDTTGESPTVRARALKLAACFQAPTKLVVMGTDVETCVQRQSAPGRDERLVVGEDVVRRTFASIQDQMDGIEREGWGEIQTVAAGASYDG